MTHDHDAVSDGRRHQRLAEPVTLRLHVRLDEVFPPVWRRIEVASDLGLDDLHEVLQVVFDWEDAHLHRFTTGPQLDPGQAFVAGFDLLETWDDEDGGTPEWQVRLDELLAEPGERLHYQYDYGDNWWLTLELEDIADDGVPAGRAVCTGGARERRRPRTAAAHRGTSCWLGRWIRAIPIMVSVGWSSPGCTAAMSTRPASGCSPSTSGGSTTGLSSSTWTRAQPTPSAVGPALTTLLIRARTPQTHLRLRAMAAAADQPVEIDVATATTMTHAYRWLLHRLGDDGVKLTAAGYLPPVTCPGRVRGARSGDEWIGAGNREDLTVPVLELRESARRLGLLRKYRGRLLPTARGRALADDPAGLWRHLASRLPIGGRNETDAEWQAGVLLLGTLAIGTADDADVTIATCLSDLGWQQGDGDPIDRLTVIRLIRGDVQALRRLGALTADGPWPGHVSTGGVKLARFALGMQR